MPMAGIGTFMLSPKDAENSVASALESGVRLIDTANAYANALMDWTEKGILPKYNYIRRTKKSLNYE